MGQTKAGAPTGASGPQPAPLRNSRIEQMPLRLVHAPWGWNGQGGRRAAFANANSANPWRSSGGKLATRLPYHSQMPYRAGGGFA